VTSHLLTQKFAEDGWLDPIPDNLMGWLKENFDQVYRDSFTNKGKVYGLSDVHGFQILFHNLDHYKEVGLAAPPSTMDELMSHARKLVKFDAQKNMVRSGVSLRISGGGSGVAEKFNIFLFANGGAVMEPAGPGKWKANFANEAGYKAFNFYMEALHKYKVDSYEVKHDEEAFLLGNTSQFNRETYVIGNAVKRAPQMNYGIAQAVKGTQRATNLNLDGWIVASSGKNKDAAWDFAKYLNKDKYLVMMMRDVGWICTRSGVDYSEVYAKEPHFKQALDRPKDMKLIMHPPAVSNNEVFTKFASRLVEAYADASMLDNRDKIMKFLKEASEEVNQILKAGNEYGE
ncbi:MAG TPA: extracellular solute-binding protein, partial [Spirochaetia bacterium]|nr:extracellular solute-binding protein [Spirochaetia bacterium]